MTTPVLMASRRLMWMSSWPLDGLATAGAAVWSDCCDEYRACLLLDAFPMISCPFKMCCLVDSAGVAQKTEAPFLFATQSRFRRPTAPARPGGDWAGPVE